MKSLTEELRAELKKPFGEIVGEGGLLEAVRGGNPLITIGDYCAALFLKKGIRPDVIIYDLKTKREPVDQETQEILEKNCRPVKVKSPPGFITRDLLHTVKAIILGGKGDILVEGEEDLAGLVALAYAPLGAIVVYGMPDQGAVVVKLNMERQKKAQEMLDSMPESS